MSYCGKSDFSDTIELYGFDYIKKSSIYVGNVGPLLIKEEKDLIPYYPYIISSAGFSKEKANIFLTQESWIDIEEKQWIETSKEIILREYHRCKCQKKPFTFDRLPLYTELDKEIFKRILKDGDKANFDSIHDRTHTQMRMELLDYADDKNIINHPIFFEVTKKVKEFEDLYDL